MIIISNTRRNNNDVIRIKNENKDELIYNNSRTNYILYFF